MWAAVAQPVLTVTQLLVLFQHGPKDWKACTFSTTLVDGSCTGRGKMRGLKRATLQQMLERKCRHGLDSARMHDMQFMHVRMRVSIFAHQWHVRGGTMAMYNVHHYMYRSSKQTRGLAYTRAALDWLGLR